MEGCRVRHSRALVCNSRREISSGYKSSIFDTKSNEQERKLLRRSQSADRIRTSNLLPACKPSRPSTPAYDSATEMHATPRHLLVGRTPDGLWPSMKSLSLSYGLNSKKNAVSERKWIPLSRKTSCHSENARPVEDLHGRTVDQARWHDLSSRKVPGHSHVSDKWHKQLRSEIERKCIS